MRKCVASSFVLLKKYGWDETLVAQFMEVLHANILTGHTDSVPDGLKFHVVDIFFEELEKVAAGTVSHSSLICMYTHIHIKSCINFFFINILT